VIDEIPARLHEAVFVDNPLAGAVFDRQYQFTEINKRWADLFGYSASEMEKHSLMDLAEMQSDRREIETKLLTMVEGHGEYDHITLVCRTKLGSLRKVVLTIIAVRHEQHGDRFEYAMVWASDLGPYGDEVTTAGRLRRLWPAIVPTSVVLWMADFDALAQLILKKITGLD
jgi:PAS domain S-box-containing protein